jgi:hypothetical protein
MRDVILKSKEVVKPLLLDKISVLMSPVTVSSAFLCSNHLDIPKFLQSLEIMIQCCPWLVCSLQMDEISPNNFQGMVYVKPRKDPNRGDGDDDEKGYLLIEIDDMLTEYSSQIPIQNLLPSKNHIKLERLDLALKSVQDLPICALKLTQFSNQKSVLGYRLNHVFYDQSSVVYFFIFLSHLYSNCLQATIPPPIFQPRSCLVNPEKPYFTNPIEYQNSAPKGYQPSGFKNSFGTPLTLKLQFNSPVIERYKSYSDPHIPLSGNDLFHAVLSIASLRFRLETCSDPSSLLTLAETSSRVLFARNMRPLLGRPLETTGDYVRLEVLHPPESSDSSQLSKQTTANLTQLQKDIVFYAQHSRQHLQQTSFPYRGSETPLSVIYETECAWFLEYSQRNPLAGNPSGAFMNDPFACVVTNWSSFPYEKIQFVDHYGDGDGDGNVVTNRSSVEEILIEPLVTAMGCGCYCRIIFAGQGVDRKVIACMDTLHDRMISLVQEIIEETQLFIQLV